MYVIDISFCCLLESDCELKYIKLIFTLGQMNLAVNILGINWAI